jgi:hypothetical protein
MSEEDGFANDMIDDLSTFLVFLSLQRLLDIFGAHLAEAYKWRQYMGPALPGTECRVRHGRMIFFV